MHRLSECHASLPLVCIRCGRFSDLRFLLCFLLFLKFGNMGEARFFISSSSDPCSSPTYVSPAFRSPFGKTDAMRMASPNQVYYKICSEKSRDHHALSRYTVRRHPDEDARL